MRAFYMAQDARSLGRLRVLRDWAGLAFERSERTARVKRVCRDSAQWPAPPI